jgi:hypothetical protein
VKVVILVAVLIRLVLIPLPGNTSDIATFVRFADQVLDHGPQSLYDPADLGRVQGHFTYPPLFPMLLAGSLWIERDIAQLLRGTSLERVDAISSEFDALVVKTWAVLGDAFLAWVAWREVHRSRGRRWAAVVVGAILCSPAIAYGGAFWGQIDAMLAACVVAAVTSMLNRQWMVVGAWMAVGMLLKPQMVVVMPVVGLGVMMIGRIEGVIRAGVGSVGAGAVLTAPFWITGRLGVLGSAYLHAAGAYPAVTVNADNAWIALCAIPLGLTCGSDADLVAWGLTYGHVGLLALGACVALILALLVPEFLFLAQVGRGSSVLFERENRARAAIFLGTSVSFIAFFMVPTQVHERYLLPGVALLAISIANYRDARVLYVIFSATLLANLLAVVPISVGLAQQFLHLGFNPQKIAWLNCVAFLGCFLLMAEASRISRSSNHSSNLQLFIRHWSIPGVVSAVLISFVSVINYWSFMNVNESLIDWLILTCAGNVVLRLMGWLVKFFKGRSVVLGVVSTEA